MATFNSRPINIDKLPEKIRLKSCKRRNEQEKDIVRDNRDKLFDQNKKRSDVEIKCEEDKNEPLQISLRAGDNELITYGDWDILHSKFFIDMWLSTKSSNIVNTKFISNTNDATDNDVSLEDGLIGMTNIEDSKENEHNTRMTVNALHLAILAKQSTVIKSLIDHIVSSAIGNKNTSFDSVYQFIGKKVVLEFNGLNEDQFSPYDRSLNKMNALHLSCRYHPEAIKIIFDAVKQSNEKLKAAYPSLSCIVNDKENTLGKTPLHIAAKKSFIDATRYLIDNGAEIDIGDSENRTPLHRAVKYGNEKIVSFLLENDADPNHKSDSGKTPLHRATTPKIVQHLMNCDADPNAKDKKRTSAFNRLLQQNDDASKSVLDNFIATNDKGMDSSDLLLVYDFKFFKEGSHEMSKHAAMVECNSKLLFHPLLEAMTTLRWSCRSKVYIGFNILKLLFATCLTWLVIGKLGWNSIELAKQSMIIHSNSNSFDSNSSHNLEVFCQHLTSSDENFTHQKNIELRVLYCIVWLFVLLLFLSELGQMLQNIREYFKSLKNWIDMLMILSTIVFLSADLGCFFNISVTKVIPTREAAALSIFFAWFDLVLLLGKTSSVAMYIYMFINVSKTLMFFILVYSPALVAFALSFYILLLPNDVKAFDNPFKAFLKTLAMLVGELEYDGTFINIEGKTDETNSSIILAQTISVLFICFASIVIMNLLVGLTVTRMDELEAEARQVILKSHVSQFIRVQQFWYNEQEKQRKPNIVSYFFNLCKNRCDNYARQFTVFSTLRQRGMLDNDAKVCVQPNKPPGEIQVHSGFNWARNMLPTHSSYKVYIYDDWKYEPGSDTGFTFPKKLVDDTLECLKSKETMKEELKTEDQETKKSREISMVVQEFLEQRKNEKNKKRDS